MFLVSGPAFFPNSIISSHACIIFLSEASSSSHVIFNIARQRGPKGPKGPRGLVKRPEMMKSIMMTCTRDTLIAPNLSHMDFLDCPAVTGRCRLSYSSTTKDASSNEHIDPELWTINRPIFIYCFLGFGPAIFHASVISSHACIVFLSEASSSSHVILPYCASARTSGP